MRARAITLAIVTVLAVGTADAAEDAKDVEALRQEVRALQSQLEAFRTAASEMAKLNQRTAEIWARALSGESEEKTSKPTPPAKAARKPKSTPRKVSKATSVAKATPSVGRVQGKVSVPAGEPIAYVYVENVFAPPVRGKKVVIDQKNKQFVPGWAVVRRGTTIEFPNHDKIYHNVFSRSRGNSFDLGLYHSGGEAKSHTFQSAGAADVYCNIHPKMAANVLVVPNGLFAKVKPDGTFGIDNVPSGQRKIVAWSPGTSPTTKWVELGNAATVQVELTLEPRYGAHLNKSGRSYGSYE